MSNLATIDFETYSEADLLKVGAWRYSIDPSTEVLCMAYRLPGKDRFLWKPRQLIPGDICDWIENGGLIEAHNSFFELCIWRNVLRKDKYWPLIPFKNYRCSAAKGAALAMPRDLARLGKALNLDVQKDAEGRRIMLKLAKPRKPTKNDDRTRYTPEDSPEDFEKLYDYCETDVETEELASSKLIELSPKELKIFQLDQKINLRGVPIDMPLVETALRFISLYTEELTEELQTLTNGEIKTAGQLKKILDWLSNYLVFLPNLQAETVKLAVVDPTIIGDAKRLLEIRKALSGTAVKKLDAMARTVDPSDNRVRGTMLYHGATTGRWAGKMIQPHNFPRGTIKDLDPVFKLLDKGNYQDFRSEYPNVLSAISSCLRGLIAAPKGKEFMCADFSSIESRVLFWLAGEEGGLHIYKTHGKVYEDMAAYIYEKAIHEIKNPSPERLLGKHIVLGCGFQMGPPRFFSYCAELGHPVTKELADKGVNGFRTRYPKVVSYWYAMEKVAIKAVKNKGQVIELGVVRWKFVGKHLFCRLPSGRKIAYYDPEIGASKTKKGFHRDVLSFMGIDTYTKKWCRQKTYGGKLVENVTQAIARDFMADAMLRVEEENFPIIMTVHDEIVAEVKKDRKNLKQFETLMAVVPEWGKGCPVKVEGWKGRRFKK